MPGAVRPILQLRHPGAADIARMWTAAGKAASGLRHCQVRYLAINKLATRWLYTDFDGWHRIQQGLAIGVARCRKKALTVRIFHELTHIHDRDVITHMLHNAQIMADEQIG